MKKFLIFCTVLGFLACKETPKSEGTPIPEKEISDSPYPDDLDAVFAAHGGLELWKSQRSLQFEIPKDNGAEVHTVNLLSRMDRVDRGTTSMGSDGQQVWLSDPDALYQGDPVFYHNLMFYFYAMPFVVADPGIQYEKADDLIYEGTTYPGIRITYDEDVGTSPKDEYYLHYDPEIHKMAWLGYTVTYKSNEPSEDVRWIRYNDWTEVSGLLLPKSITWHAYEGRTIKEPKSTVAFENIRVSKQAQPTSLFATPEGATVILGAKQ